MESKNVSVEVLGFNEQRNSVSLQLNNVRLGFRCLWHPNVYQGKVTGRQTASFLFREDELDELKKLSSAAVKVLKIIDPSIEKASQAMDNRFPTFKDEKTGEVFYTFRTSNSEKWPPRYVDERGRVVNDLDPDLEDKVLYQGCRVNCTVTLTANPSSRGKGKVDLWSNLDAIQFCDDDTRMGGRRSDDDIASNFGAVKRQLPTSNPPAEDKSFDLDPAPKSSGKSIDLDEL